MQDHTTAAEKAAIPAGGRTFHGTVTKVEKSTWTTSAEKPLYKITISDEHRITAEGFECDLTLGAPVVFGAAYDITIKPAPSE